MGSTFIYCLIGSPKSIFSAYWLDVRIPSFLLSFLRILGLLLLSAAS